MNSVEGYTSDAEQSLNLPSDRTWESLQLCIRLPRLMIRANNSDDTKLEECPVVPIGYDRICQISILTNNHDILIVICMTDLTTITARDILRDYKNIFDSIKKTKRPTVVMSHKEPQVAIISLDDLDTLQKLKSKNSAKSLLDFASNARTLLAKEKLPHDLAANHNNYLWGN